MDPNEVMKNFPAVFESAEIKEIIKLAQKYAGHNIPILLVGETGTGKEIFADLIHSLSPRSANPLIKVNCATIPQELAESLFFGSVKGSYSGSIGDTVGYFEQANNGTIFLDELPEMPYHLQSKLLRVLQDGKFRPVGAKTDTVSNFRIIWASNTPIEEAIASKKLRQDLYYRISDAQISIPPLRCRADAIVPLAAFFLGQAAKEFGREIHGFSEEAMGMLKAYEWPGNIRQLRAAVRNAVLVCESGTINPCDIAKNIGHNPSLSRLENVERDEIRKVLRTTDNNRTEAAKALGLGRTTLYRKIDEYGLSHHSKVDGEKVDGTPIAKVVRGNGNGDVLPVPLRGTPKVAETSAKPNKQKRT